MLVTGFIKQSVPSPVDKYENSSTCSLVAPPFGLTLDPPKACFSFLTQMWTTFNTPTPVAASNSASCTPRHHLPFCASSPCTATHPFPFSCRAGQQRNKTSSFEVVGDHPNLTTPPPSEQWGRGGRTVWALAISRLIDSHQWV